MSAHARPVHVLGGLLRAGGRERADTTAAPRDAATIRQAAGQCVGPEALNLMVRLHALLPRAANKPAIVQVLPCSLSASARPVADCIAQAASVLTGRTLLLDASGSVSNDSALSNDAVLLPDAFLPGLYHYRIRMPAGALDALLANHLAPPAPDRRPFRWVIVWCSAPCAGSLALALTTACNGALLVVHCARTTQAEVRYAASSIEAAGGKLLGTLLADVEPPAPRQLTR